MSAFGHSEALSHPNRLPFALSVPIGASLTMATSNDAKEEMQLDPSCYRVIPRVETLGLQPPALLPKGGSILPTWQVPLDCFCL
ncbi:hypothetical protein GN956_G10795 [Arapaima gigas]